MKMEQNKAVFLDRDGTLNPDPGFISRLEDFELYSYAAEAVKLLNDNGFYTFLVTNQSGIARGKLTFDDLSLIHKKMTSSLVDKGAYLDEIFVSPYFEQGTVEPYNIAHEDRKPGIGLFRKAQAAFNFTVKGSFMIGDRYTDIVFGAKSGLKTIFLLSGVGMEQFLNHRSEWEYQPDFIARNLIDAAMFIINQQSNTL